MEAASGFASQSQLKSTCFGTLWKSRNGFSNKSGEYFELRCTERETGEGKTSGNCYAKPENPTFCSGLKLLARVHLVCPVTCFLTASIRVNTFRLDAWLQRTKNVWKIQLNARVKVVEGALKEGHHQGVKRPIFPLQCKP